jgi:hypothetical protein
MTAVIEIALPADGATASWLLRVTGLFMRPASVATAASSTR